ncbi:MAG: TonB-dependent receptor [Tannerella sp.]|jgi:iron complex outermembrane receptor protein|nr:TonB-dependent receptor [Tannerella sp.]
MKRKRINEQRVFRFRRFVRKAYGAFNSMHKVVNIGVVAGCMLAFAHTGSTSAQTVTTKQHPDQMPEEDLDEVTVTATRIESPIGQASAPVTVVTAAQIEKAPVQSVEELLAYVANIDVVQRGGHGVQADISIRGGSADQTAILLNGINLTNPHTGHYSFDLPLNLSDIERIEIIHSSSTLLYGFGAFSGGINIITKKKLDSRMQAGVKAGMYNLHEAEIRGALATDHTDNSLSLGYKASDGYMEHSDYRLLNLFWQTRREIDTTAKSHIDLQLGYNNKSYGANTFYSAAYPNQYERTGAWLTTLKGSFGRTLQCIPALYWNRHYDRFDLIRNTETGRNYHRNDSYGANLIFRYTSPLGVTSLGGEWRREEILSSKLGQPIHPQGYYTHYDVRNNADATFGHTISRKRFTASAGIRMNHNTLTGGLRFYPSAGAMYQPNQAFRIHTTWSRSTRLPTFTDLYYTTETHTADEQLRPERSESLDGGVEYTHSLVSAHLSAFLMWGRDIIDWVRESAADKWASWNLTEIDKRGIETGLTFRPGNRWTALHGTLLSVGYARMSQTCNTHGLESRYSLNYLRDKLTIQLSHPIYRGLSAGWYFRCQKRMGVFAKYENGTATGLQPYPAFSTLDFRVSYIFRTWKLYLDVNNLYDTYYYDIGNVPQAGRWLTGGIIFRID